MPIRKSSKRKSKARSNKSTVRRSNKSEQRIKLKRSQVPFLKDMFPDYNGRRIEMQRKKQYVLHSHDLFWSGGYKKKVGTVDIYGNIDTSINAKSAIMNPMLTTAERKVIDIPDDLAIVELQYAGREKWVNIYVSPNSKIAPNLLESKN